MNLTMERVLRKVNDEVYEVLDSVQSKYQVLLFKMKSLLSKSEEKQN